jgi:hypothetical protein
VNLTRESGRKKFQNRKFGEQKIRRTENSENRKFGEQKIRRKENLEKRKFGQFRTKRTSTILKWGKKMQLGIIASFPANYDKNYEGMYLRA